MTTKVFFTSDTHFGHKSLIDRGLRKMEGHPTIEDHDRELILRWNLFVGKNDTVYHLGDFAWHDLAKYRKALNGRIHLIMGNHDRLKSTDKSLFESISDIKSLKVEGQRIYLCHYAMKVWNFSHYGSWHLYGHSHGSLPDDPNSLSFDVGVDCWGFFPVSFEAVKRVMSKKTFKPVDHHEPR